MIRVVTVNDAPVGSGQLGKDLSTSDARNLSPVILRNKAKLNRHLTGPYLDIRAHLLCTFG
jgi:hypothetical protein